MSELELMNALYDGTILRCSFDKDKKFADKQITYSYKSNLKNIEPGDDVYIKSKYGYIRSVTVIEVISNAILEPDTKYKWAIAKVDTKAYDEQVANDEAALALIRSAKRSSLRSQIIDNSGIDKSELVRLGLISQNELGDK